MKIQFHKHLSLKASSAFLFLALIFGTPLISNGQQKFQITVLNKDQKFTPGQRHTLVLEVSNYHTRSSNYKGFVKFPESWEVLNEKLDLQVPPGESGFMLISFFIPTKQPPGEVTGEFMAWDSEMSTPLKFDLKFEVEAKRNLQVKRLSFPNSVQSGESIRVNFEIKNEGNITEEVELISPHSIVGDRKLQVKPDSSVIVEVQTPTDKKNYFLHSINTDLEVKSTDTQKSFKAYSSTTVFPTKIKRKDAFYRLPVEFSVYNNSFFTKNTWEYSHYFEGRGNGFLDVEEKHYVNFIVRAPNQTRISRFGVADQYSLEYVHNGRTKIHIGDHSFGLNRLGFNGRYGMGIWIEQPYKKWTLSAFYTKPRLFYASKKPIIGGKAEYQFSNNLRGAFSISSTSELAQYYGYQVVKSEGQTGQIGAFNLNYENGRTRSNAEVAVSQTQGKADLAGDFSLSQKMGKILYNGSVTFAGREFFGTLSNSLRFSNSLALNQGKWNFLLGQGYSKVNEWADSTLYGIRPFIENYFGAIGYRLNTRHYFNLRVDQRKREDRSDEKTFNYEESGANFMYKFTKQTFDISASARIAKTTNLLSDIRERHTTYGESVNISKRISNSFSFRSNFNHTNTVRYSATNESSDYFFYGVGLNFTSGRSFRISGTYNNGFSPEESYRKRDFINASMVIRANRHHEFEARANYFLNPNTINTEEVFAYLKYTYKLGVPIKKILNQGTIIGMASSTSPELSLKGIEFIASGVKVKSDENGRFEINNLPIGTNFLLINEASVPPGVVCIDPAPIVANVSDGGKEFIKVRFAPAAEIKGRIQVLGSRIEQDLSGYIKIETDNFTYYTESNKAGEFQFQKIVPGTYRLTVLKLTDGKNIVPVDQKRLVNTEDSSMVGVEYKLKERKINFKGADFNLGN